MTKRVPTKPATLSFHIRQFRRGSRRRLWAAYSSFPYSDLSDIGQGIDATRREVAAKVLEEIAKDIRSGRHKASLIVSITNAYLGDPTLGMPEIEVHVKALREFADDLEQRWRLDRQKAVGPAT